MPQVENPGSTSVLVVSRGEVTRSISVGEEFAVICMLDPGDEEHTPLACILQMKDPKSPLTPAPIWRNVEEFSVLTTQEARLLADTDPSILVLQRVFKIANPGSYRIGFGDLKSSMLPQDRRIKTSEFVVVDQGSRTRTGIVCFAQ